MMQRISSTELLLEQAAKLAREPFPPGFDDMTAETAERWMRCNAEQVSRALREGRFRPQPALSVQAEKKQGHYQRQTRLTALDTVVQRCAAAVLCEERGLFSARTSGRSFPVQARRQALECFCGYGSEHEYACVLTLTDPCSRMSHDVFEEQLPLLTEDPKVRQLILRFLKTPVWDEERLCPTERGLLPGMPLSELLSRLYLYPAEAALTEQNLPYLRYGEELILFSGAYHTILGAADLVTEILEDRLNLGEVTRQLDAPAELICLGHRFQAQPDGRVRIASSLLPETTYTHWQESRPSNDRRTVDILSSGRLCRKDGSLVFVSNETETELPVLSLDIINLHSNVQLETGALAKALDHGTILNLFHPDGALAGQFVPDGPLRAPRVTFDQLGAYYDEPHRLQLARLFVLASIHNLRLNIRYYIRQQGRTACQAELDTINELARRIKQAQAYQELLLLEGQVRMHYYNCYDHFLTADGFVFEKRSRRPAHNRVNAMLNFGNTVLSSIFSHLIQTTPLDVRVGFLHATSGRRKQSLNLDLAEIMKPLVVDRTMFAMINRRAIQPHHFRTDGEGGVLLNEEGKRLYLSALYDKLDTIVTVRDKKLSYRQIMSAEVYKLVRHFRDGERYVPFKQVR